MPLDGDLQACAAGRVISSCGEPTALGSKAQVARVPLQRTLGRMVVRARRMRASGTDLARRLVNSYESRRGFALPCEVEVFVVEGGAVPAVGKPGRMRMELAMRLGWMPKRPSMRAREVMPMGSPKSRCDSWRWASRAEVMWKSPGQRPMNMESSSVPLKMRKASSGIPACQRARAMWEFSASRRRLSDHM